MEINQVSFTNNENKYRVSFEYGFQYQKYILNHTTFQYLLRIKLGNEVSFYCNPLLEVSFLSTHNIYEKLLERELSIRKTIDDCVSEVKIFREMIKLCKDIDCDEHFELSMKQESQKTKLKKCQKTTS